MLFPYKIRIFLVQRFLCDFFTLFLFNVIITSKSHKVGLVGPFVRIFVSGLEQTSPDRYDRVATETKQIELQQKPSK